jgi:hypothetical protein
MTKLAQTKPVFQRAMRIINNITNANPAQVTTSFAHQYGSGEIVRLVLPRGFGMQQANQLTGIIAVIDPTNFSINIDTTFFDVFSTPVAFPLKSQYSQVVPVAEISAQLTGATQNVLPYPATP